MIRKPTPEELIRHFQNDAFARFTGCEIIEAGEGWAKVRMGIDRHHLNGVGLVHGGAVYMAADLAGAVAANSHGHVAVTLSATATYMKPGQGGSILATAREVSRSRKIGVYAVDVIDEASGETIASFQQTAFVTEKDLSHFGQR